MNQKKQIIIIGGGIIGLSCAVKLAEKGAEVVVLDKNKVGFGCSYGNAGWMTPCFAMPLPMPGLFFKSLKWLLNPESPLYIKPSVSPFLFQWLTKFMLSMTESKATAAIEALVALSKVSLDEYEKLAAEFPEIQFEKKGLLMVSHSQQGVDAAVQEMELVKPHLIPGKFMTPEEIRSFEPSLKGPLRGGVFFSNEAHAEPLKVVQALEKKAKALGVHILEGVEFFKAQIENNQIRSILTSAGEMQASEYILATGSWSHDIAQELRLPIPVMGGKGYSMIVPTLSTQPLRPLMLVEKKIAITPRQGSLRIAGTLELVDQDYSISHRRVQAIIRGAREYLPVPEQLEIRELWRGLRPCTPDGLPLIGYSDQIQNLMLACGHQMLGLQTGIGTGILVAELMTDGKSTLNRNIYSPNRF